MGYLSPADTTVLGTDILLMVEWVYNNRDLPCNGSLGRAGGAHSSLGTIPGIGQVTQLPPTIPMWLGRSAGGTHIRPHQPAVLNLKIDQK